MTDPDPVAQNPSPGHFADNDHALKTGMLLGTLVKAGIHVIPDTDGDGNYLAQFTVELPPADDMESPIEIWVKVLSGPDAL